MIIDDSLLNESELLNLKLRKLFLNKGFQPYSMSKFEEYDLYAKNKDFLLSDNVITFTDTDGKLLALKPDVTLSIIKNTKDSDDIQRIFYSENVYRVSKSCGQFKEIMQTGVECFGPITEKEVFEVFTLATESLRLISDDWVISYSNVDLLLEILQPLELNSKETAEVIKAISEKNSLKVIEILGDIKEARIISELIKLHKPIDNELLGYLRDLIGNYQSYKTFEKSFLEKVNFLENRHQIFIDFSAVDDVNYYNGIVFKGFIKGIPNAVLSGGQYGKLMKKLKRSSKAIGFAVYTDELERLDSYKDNDDYLNIALPKGRLGEKVYKMFSDAGFDCESILEQNRKLIFENPEKKVRYFWVKPSDVAIYVERGAADIGVAGKDILLEYEPDIFELLDLDIGKCRMAVAGHKGFKYDNSKKLIVATKFSNIAKKYYQSLGMNIDIVHLNGSIELAPILGLSDVIVDIVETGATLRENNLDVVEEIFPISARLIANKSSFKFKANKIEELTKKLSKEL